MDREMMGRQLDDLTTGDSLDIDKDTLKMLFLPGEAADVIDERTQRAASKFAKDHRCRFLFNDQSSKSTFSKLPDRWHELIDNLCTNLGSETPGTESFRIKIDHKMREAEARASHAEAVSVGETPSSANKNFRRRCTKFCACVRTAIRRMKMFGLRLCNCSITLAFASPRATEGRLTEVDSAARCGILVDALSKVRPLGSRVGTAAGLTVMIPMSFDPD